MTPAQGARRLRQLAAAAEHEARLDDKIAAVIAKALAETDAVVTAFFRADEAFEARDIRKAAVAAALEEADVEETVSPRGSCWIQEHRQRRLDAADRRERAVRLRAEAEKLDLLDDL